MKYTLSQLRAMFEPEMGAARKIAPRDARQVRLPNGRLKQLPALSRSKYTPHQGKAEMARRAARLAA